MSNDKCARCGASINFPLQQQQVRCRRCGTTIRCETGNAVSKPVLPLDHGNQLGTWMLTHERPTMCGLYDVRYKELEPRVLQLYWDGRAFSILLGGQRVSDATLLTWRGSYAL